jgi:ABC-type nitrate/sulfonate/bicarbonate transport system substrate-binding protein
MQGFAVIFLSAAIVLGAWLPPLSAQITPDKITLGTMTLSLDNLPIYGAHKGFFAKENLFVEAVVLNTSTTAIPALIGGSTQISASSQ